MTVLKTLGLAVAIGLIVLAGVLAHTPWRVHGGRFITEYMILAVPVALVGAAILAVTLWFK